MADVYVPNVRCPYCGHLGVTLSGGTAECFCPDCEGRWVDENLRVRVFETDTEPYEEIETRKEIMKELARMEKEGDVDGKGSGNTKRKSRRSRKRA